MNPGITPGSPQFCNAARSIDCFGTNLPGVFTDPNIMCLRCEPHSKEPVRGKPIQYFSCGNLIIKDWLKQGGNVGATSLTGFAVFIDGDTEEIRSALETSFNEVFKWSTGKEGHFQYAFFLEDKPFTGPIPLKDGAYLKTKPGYVLIPPSIHPNGRRYGETIVGDKIPIVRYGDLYNVLKPFFARETVTKKEPVKQGYEAARVDTLKMAEVVDLSKLKKSGNRYQGAHPVHGSETGMNFTVDLDLNVWHCFRHGTGGGPLQWIAVREGIIDCAECVPGALKGDLFWEAIAAAYNKYGLDAKSAARLIRGEVK